MRPSQPIGVPLGLSVLIGLGVGGTSGLGFIIIQYSIPQQLMGIGIGCLTTLRSFGGSVGVAIFNAIVRSKQNASLPGAISAAALEAGATESEVPSIIQAAISRNSSTILNATNGNDAVVGAVTTAYERIVADSYR